MEKNRMNNSDFIRELSKRTGYMQTDIKDVLEASADLIKENLSNDVTTVPFIGMIIYPATYNNTVTFPRARFTKAFRGLAPLS